MDNMEAWLSGVEIHYPVPSRQAHYSVRHSNFSNRLFRLFASSEQEPVKLA
jgi:hypothetical protein